MSEVKPITVYRHSGYLVNLKNITEDEKERALDMFTYSMYDDKSCNKCPNLEYRHSEVCDNCASFLGHKRLAKDVDMGKEVMLSLPYGATNRVRKWLKSLKRPYKVIDRHPEPTPFRRPIKFTGSLRDYQLEAVGAIFENKKGLIKAPPRSGKTVIGTGFICKNGQKTLILASQREWLIGFQETFLGGENSEALTNARPSQVKFCKTVEDFQNTDVALATFQQFMNPNGRKVLEKIKSLFNVVMVDECFTKDHEVLTPSGYIPIDLLAKDWQGKEVVSWNHYKGVAEAKSVISSRVKTSTKLVKVTIDGVTYKCTPEHPFWSETKQAYVQAKDLQPHDKVRLLSSEKKRL